jgi:hypothetical protein
MKWRDGEKLTSGGTSSVTIPAVLRARVSISIEIEGSESFL